MLTKPWFIRLASIQFREVSSNPRCDAAARKKLQLLFAHYPHAVVLFRREGYVLAFKRRRASTAKTISREAENKSLAHSG